MPSGGGVEHGGHRIQVGDDGDVGTAPGAERGAATRRQRVRLGAGHRVRKDVASVDGDGIARKAPHQVVAEIERVEEPAPGLRRRVTVEPLRGRLHPRVGRCGERSLPLGPARGGEHAVGAEAGQHEQGRHQIRRRELRAMDARRRRLAKSFHGKGRKGDRDQPPDHDAAHGEREHAEPAQPQDPERDAFARRQARRGHPWQDGQRDGEDRERVAQLRRGGEAGRELGDRRGEGEERVGPEVEGEHVRPHERVGRHEPSADRRDDGEHDPLAVHARPRDEQHQRRGHGGKEDVAVRRHDVGQREHDERRRARRPVGDEIRHGPRERNRRQQHDVRPLPAGDGARDPDVEERDDDHGPRPPACGAAEQEHGDAGRRQQRSIEEPEAEVAPPLVEPVLDELREPRVRVEGRARPRPRPRLHEGDRQVLDHPLAQREMSRQVGIADRAQESRRQPERHQDDQMPTPLRSEASAPLRLPRA